MSGNVIENLTDRLSSLPGIGRKSAKRLAYYIINMSENDTFALIHAIELAKKSITKCKICGNFSESEICPICASEFRDKSKLMVVQNPKDVESFEKTNCYDGQYFVLDEEALNPLKGIGPEELGLLKLEKRLQEDGEIEEVILALNSNVESEQTGLLVKAVAQKAKKRVTRISQGIPAGGVLEYFDTQTIRRALEDRREV